MSENAAFSCEGIHTNRGYAVIVLSGSTWQSHNLSRLIESGGRIWVEAAGLKPSDWELQFVANGAQTQSIPLAKFDLDPDKRDALSYPLAAVQWGGVNPASVVGVALRRAGPPGSFKIRFSKIAVRSPTTNYGPFALGATSALSPHEPAQEALLAAGPIVAPMFLQGWMVPLRGLAALLFLIGMLGPRAFRSFGAANPTVLFLGFAAGLAAPAAVQLVLPFFLEPRVEHMPVVLAFLNAGMIRLALAKEAPAPQPKAATAPASGVRIYTWLDALKVAAAVSVVAIHVTSDPQGLPYQGFAPGARIAPLMLRALALCFDYHVFFIVSLFLLADSLRRRPKSYAEIIQNRRGRILRPFVFWSAAFLLGRNAKALAFGYSRAYHRELADWSTWLPLPLGTAQYHLHFLPLLAALILFYPLFVPAIERPGFCLGLLSLALLPITDPWIYGHVASPVLRAYALFTSKTLAYLGYGLFGFAMYGVYSRGIPAGRRRLWWLAATAIGGLSLAVIVGHMLKAAALGDWPAIPFFTHMALSVMPACTFLFFMLADEFPLRLSFPFLRELSRLSYGIYLIHPMFLDLMEILERSLRWRPAVTVCFNLICVLAASIAAVRLIAASPRWAWTIGADS
ncbi:MAG: acyltransferase [Elusimicrobia bacterium]|nr:acyltransferase [Elusimicrobiota bacterium]